jgi:RNA polymerase sigma-70 factor (ECF subfamily)
MIMSTLEDLELIQQIRAGDEGAFYPLVERYQTGIYNLTFRMLDDAFAAEDATQEVFIKAYSRLTSFDSQYSFKSWLYAIASNHCIDIIRKRRFLFLSLDDPLSTEPVIADPALHPEEQALRNEQSQQIQKLLHTLPETDRVMIVLLYWLDCSYDEIAKITQTSVSAVKSRLHRARATLAQQMQAQPSTNKRIPIISPTTPATLAKG